MEIGYNRGIVISDGTKKIILDPESPKTPIGIPTLISHAHSDHTSGLRGLSQSYCTPITKELYEATTAKVAKNTLCVDFFEQFEVGELEIEFVPAGHLLGAAQIIVRHGDETLLYTGDFCPEPLLSVPGAHIPNESIDVCIIETTYGDKSLRFSERSESRINIFKHCIQLLSNNRYPVLNVSQLGGAQELISLFDRFSNGLSIVLDEKIIPPTEVYSKQNNHLPSTIPLDEFKFNEPAIILLSRSTKELPSKLHDIPVSRGMISGQSARFQFSRFDFTVPLSTHANYFELLHLIDQTVPTSVYTHYNYAKEFAEVLQLERSIPALPLTSLKDRTLNVTEVHSHGGGKGVQMTLNDFF